MSQQASSRPIVHEIDDFDLEQFLPVAARFGQERYGFVVTPNVDHLIRFNDNAEFRKHYRAASFILMDSRFASRLVRLAKGLALGVCTGSDLTAALFGRIISPSDRILLIGGSAEQAEEITQRFSLKDLHHHNPPMGFVRDAAATERCLEFIETASPFRFCFLAVGSPQQEIVAHALQTRGRARGLALCIGASLNFITGAERRAPLWMQNLGIEWLYRLLQNPRRLAGRYLVRGPRIFAQLRYCEFIRRPRAPAVD